MAEKNCKESRNNKKNKLSYCTLFFWKYFKR